MAQGREFTCFVEDSAAHERFSAHVTVAKKTVIRESEHDRGKIEIADIFIRDVSGLLDRWVTITEGPDGKPQARGTAKDAHGHFVVFKVTGQGKYVRRNRYGKIVEKRFCSTWDLGHSFGSKVDAILREMM